MSLELRPLDLIAQYAADLRGSIDSLGNQGGFSGAQLWRLDAPCGSFALKAWPTAAPSPLQLAWIHRLMALASAFPWMPTVMRTRSGATFAMHHDRLWEVVRWMPGAANTQASISARRLTAACTALAELHLAWGSIDANYDVCPAVVRRLSAWRSWHEISGRPRWETGDPYARVAEPLWEVVLACVDEVPGRLTPWLTRRLSVQPCVCDLWRDHVLFEGDAVTGVIDFGSAKIDHVAVDLARLLGSFVGADPAQWQIGLGAYARVRPLADWEISLARDLDRTGTIIAATNWLRWLYHERRRFENPQRVVDRLSALLERLAGQRHFS